MTINNNPWKGLDSYSNSDCSIFYGRNSETDALVDIIINNRFTILYGPSGVGKSSLLNAGICPRLAKTNYFVIDVSMRQIDFNSQYSISSQIISRVYDCALMEKVDITSLSKDFFYDDFSDSLWYFFHTKEFWSSQNELLTPIVIIDQFEEVFKDEVQTYITESFFNDLDELSNVVPPLSIREKIGSVDSFRYKQSSEFRLVCSLREDYLPRLDDYVYSINIPELRKSRFGITLMDADQAREVILCPAKGIVSTAVSDKIIELLSAQSSFQRQSRRIEPFLLSLFMYRVYIEMKKRGLTTISDDLINKIGLDIVNDFYIESMKKVSPKAMKHLENVLLTPKGHRDSISYDKLMDSEKVTDEELKTLLDARIINRNTVNNVDRFEFTHDILSKYAQKNKEKREQNNKYQKMIGYYGTILTLLVSALIGWVKSSIITYFFIPILIIIAILNSFAIFNLKLSAKKRTTEFLGICGLIGLCFDLTQIIPLTGYVIYLGACIYSYNALRKFSNNCFFNKLSIPKISFVWTLSFIIVPILCFGYNIYNGMNYSRGDEFTSGLFYVRNAKGQYGLRNRRTLLIRPQFEDTLHKVGNEYIAKSDGKYGLLDSTFQIKIQYNYDSFIAIDNSPYFYINGKEVAGNGLKISWHETVSEDQKRILRKIVSNMTIIDGGEFKMGTNEKRMKKMFSAFKPTNGEEIVHNVSLSDFYLNKYEVTLEEWIGIMGYDPRKRPEHCKSDSINNLQIPVYKVSYETCQRFIDKISILTGISFSLPTEAQWEYAARGGKNDNNYVFSGSNNEFDVGWISRNSDNIMHPVGKKTPNNLGLYDMTGNAAEFCKDCFSSSFYGQSRGERNPCCKNGETSKSKKYIVQRGGSFDSYSPEYYNITRRHKAFANIEYKHIGFRLAINP